MREDRLAKGCAKLTREPADGPLACPLFDFPAIQRTFPIHASARLVQNLT
jgi:hypothetical protein